MIRNDQRMVEVVCDAINNFFSGMKENFMEEVVFELDLDG